MNQSAVRKVSYYQASPVECCSRCSAGIKHVFVVSYTDGLTEKYGSECINKILDGDTSLGSLFNKNVKLLAKHQRALEAISSPEGTMPRGSEYFGSGLYFVADSEGKDVMADGHFFFHPVYDQEKNHGGDKYVVKDTAAYVQKCHQEIEGKRGKQWLAAQISRIETFLGRVVQKGLLDNQAVSQ